MSSHADVPATVNMPEVACQTTCERETTGRVAELGRFTEERVPKMRLTKQTGHAIRILIDCAQAGDSLVKVAEISDRLDITKQNVFKIVHILSRTGFIAAVRGPSGGVRLAKAAANIRIGDVVRAIEVTDVEIDGEARVDVAVVRGQTASKGSINSVFDDALMAFVSVLDQHTLADLVQKRRSEPQPSTAVTKATKRPAATKSVAAPRR